MRTSDNLDGTFTNPVIFSDYPDPDIIRVGDDYYLASSSFTDAPGIPVCHSRDLINWRIIGHAYHRLPESNPAYSMTGGQVAYRGGSWAPSLRHRDGLFYIAFNTPAEGFFMCISPRPEGPYEMISFGGVELYDPGLFFDDDGRAYVVHGANDIFLTELSADARTILSPPRHLYTTAHGTPLEGSHVHKRGGLYYICNTTRGYNGIQLVYRSENILGPYDSRLVCADDLNYAGAGLHQGGLIDLPNGDTWFCLFQDRDYVGRVPVLLPVTWTPDGWPRLGDPANFWKTPVTLPRPATGPGQPPSATEQGDDFDAPELALHWRWNHNPDDSRWSLAARPGWLRLAAAHAPDFLHARNTLAVKITGGGCLATTRLDFSALLPGDRAGLAVLGFPHALIAIEVTADGRPQIIMVNDGQPVAQTSPLPPENQIHFLRCEAGADGIARFSHSPDDATYVPLGDELVMQFSVRTFLGNKFALFCFNTLPSAPCGHADFDFLRYDCARDSANHFHASEEIPASSYDTEHGVDTHRVIEKRPRQFLVSLHHGDWIGFHHLDFGPAAPAAFHVTASSIAQGGQIELRLGGPDGELIGLCPIPGSGERNQWLCPWEKFTCPVTAPVTGVQSLFLKFTGGEGYLMRLETFTFR